MVTSPQKAAFPSRGADLTSVSTLGQQQQPRGLLRTMALITLPVLAVFAAIQVQWLLNPTSIIVNAQQVPSQAQVINQASFNGTAFT